jgi:sugar lactone lactonase YvrE
MYGGYLDMCNHNISNVTSINNTTVGGVILNNGNITSGGGLQIVGGSSNLPTNVTGSLYESSGFTTGVLTTFSGGTVSSNVTADATIYSLTSGTGTFVVPTGTPVIVDYLMVGGGGAGGNWVGGGGGAGGLVYAKGVQLPVGTYTWTVGAGGVGVTGCNVNAGNGSNSSLSNSTFGNVVAFGGGAGGTFNTTLAAVSNAGSNGGSGGGGAQNGSTLDPGGVGAIGQGNSGGSSAATAFSGAGGGGGAGAVGTSTTTTTGGAGGNGLVIPITGSNVYYAGGGGGAADGAIGIGGLGGGGAGLNALGSGISGLANTGGGGGGATRNTATYAGGSGGSGIIVIRVYTNTGSRMLIGDGSGYSMALSAQSNAVTRDVMTITDQGNVSIGLSNGYFNTIVDAKFDSLGNLYLADAGNHRIRKISPAGIVTTVCGNGLASNINGIGTAGSINGPYGIAVDTSNNLYLASSSGNQILYFNTTTSQLTIIAGTGSPAFTNVTNGSGLTAAFSSPRQMAYDPVNGGPWLYIADAGNAAIRRMTANGATYLTGMTVTTTATTGTGSLPLCVIYDGVSTLYASLYGTGYVAKITTIYATIACNLTFENVTAAAYVLNSISFDSNKTNIYATTLHSVARFPIAGGTLTTVAGSRSAGAVDAGGLSASFNTPNSIALDATGSNFYISDTANNKIRKLNLATCNVTTYAGTGTAGFVDGTVPTATVVNNTLLVSSNVGMSLGH